MFSLDSPGVFEEETQRDAGVTEGVNGVYIYMMSTR